VSAGRLPDVLAVPDVLAGEEDATVRSQHARRHRRRLPVDLAAEESQHGERAGDDHREREPKLPITQGVPFR